MKIIRRLAVNSLLLVWSLAICESLTRALFPRPDIVNFNRVEFTPTGLFGAIDEISKEGTSNVALEDFSYGDRGPIRNVTALWISDPDGVEVEHNLNLYGFRGDDFDLRKAPGVTRVIFLGDSFAEGFGVRDDESIPRVFERLAAERNVEALNLGVGGTGVPEYSRLASVAVPLFAPDWVIVVLCANDFPSQHVEDTYYRGADYHRLYRGRKLPRIVSLVSELLAGGIPTPFYHRGPFPFFLPVPHRSNPYSIETDTEGMAPELLVAVRSGRLNPLIPHASAHTEERLLTQLDDQKSGRRYLEWLSQVVERSGAKLIVAYIPSHVTVADHYLELWREFGTEFRHDTLTGTAFRQHQRYLRGLFAELEIPFIDMTSPIAAEERQGRRLYLGYDAHMNADGYELIAETLFPAFEKLISSNAVPGGPPDRP